MRSAAGVAGITVREAWRGSILIIVPIYAAFLLGVLLFYPSIDEQARFRQALSFGHGALQIGVGLICLILGASGVAADRDAGRTGRITSTPLGRAGYIVGKTMGLCVVALGLSISLWAVESILFRARFEDLPGGLRAHPILRHTSFGITPPRGLEDGNITWLRADRIHCRFPAVPAAAVRIDVDVDASRLSSFQLSVWTEDQEMRTVLPIKAGGPFTLTLPDWATKPLDTPLWIELLHTDGQEVVIGGDLRSVMTLIDRGGVEIHPEIPPVVWGVTADERSGRLTFRERRAAWEFAAHVARRAVRLTLDPVVVPHRGGQMEATVTLERGGTRAVERLFFHDGRSKSLLLPESIRSARGGLRVELVSTEPLDVMGLVHEETREGTPIKGLFLSGGARSLEWNLLLGALGASLQAMLLAAAGMTASLLFSAPVALFAGLALYVVGMGAGLFADLPEPSELNDPIAEVFQIRTSPSPTLMRLAARVAGVIPDLQRFDLKAPIVASYAIAPSRIVGLFLYSAFVSSLLLGGGWCFYRRSEFL
ncbi:MAG: hypothetical protein O6952_04580 [Planctomycetota bacterium]|nr:hypothetical protein [Planctomycetota bacterium]